jgi:hypothetical protein
MGDIMPAGMENPVLGYIAFCGVKAVGYTAATAVISRVYERSDLNAFVVGLTRTLIGMAVGASLFGVMHLFRIMHLNISPLHIQPENARLMAFGILCLVRLAEWWFLIWLFYDRSLHEPFRGWKVAVLGVVWSFVLDIPSFIGWLVVGGFYVC